MPENQHNHHPKERIIALPSASRAGESVNCLQIAGKSPAIFYLCGFYSDIEGTKIQHLRQWAHQTGYGLTCFDYRGHGQSDGRFRDCVFSDWYADTKQVFKQLTDGPQIIIGSSMGGWMAMRLLSDVEVANEAEFADRFKGALLLAPAPDFMPELLDDEMIARLRVEKIVTPYNPAWLLPDDDEYLFTEKMLDDAPANAVLDKQIVAPCPVTVIHGDADDIVPTNHAQRAFQQFDNNQGQFILLDGADHSLHRAEDLAMIEKRIMGLCQS